MLYVGWKIKNKKIKDAIFALVSFCLFSVASAQTSPQGISLQGRIVDASNNPLEDLNVVFTVHVMSPGAEECVLYEETHTVNMNGSGGVFALPLGAGTRSGAAFEDTSTLAQVFTNASAQINGLTCASGNSYTPGTGNKRKIKMSFDVGGGPQEVTQTLDIQTVPYALYADTLQGKGPADFLQTSAMTTQVKIDNLATTANYNELLALIAGTSTNYTLANGGNFTPAADVDFNGKKIVDLAAPTAATDAVNKNYSDTKFGGATLDQTGLADGQSVRWNAGSSKWEVYTPSTGQWVTSGSDIYYNTGNVGIGTVTPGSKLEVNGTAGSVSTLISGGSLRVTGGDVNGYPLTIGGSRNLVFETGVTGNIVSGNGLNFTASGISSLYLTASNKVGIGTTSPTTGAKLDITGTGAANSSIIIPRDTVANRPTVGVNGMIRYASDTNKFEAYENGAWVDMIGTATLLTAGNGSAASPSISFGGDPNTGFYSNGADTIGISANGANVFNISSSSLSSPTTGGALITSADGTASAPTFSFAGDADTGWWRPAADTMAASTGGSERVRIDSAGRVGLGTTAPTHALTFPSASSGISIYNTADQITNYERAHLYWNTNQFYINAGEYGGTGTPRALLLAGGGRVITIGNGTPFYNFDNSTGSSNVSAIGVTGTVTSSAGTNNSLAIFPTLNQSTTGGYRSLWISPFEQALGSGSHFLVDIGTNTAANGSGTHTSKFVIENSGNVGIGTTTPAAKLDVAGDIKIGDSSATCNGTTEGSQRYNTTSNKMEFCNGTAWAEIDTVGGGGTVTSVTASAPLASSGGNTPNITVSDATTGAKGVVQVGAGLNVSSGTVSVNTGTGNNQIVQLDGTAKLPAIDGSALTNVIATNVSGTVAIANGGTGATTAANARTNLGLGSAAVANIGQAAGDIVTLAVGMHCLPNQKLELSAGPVYSWACVDDLSQWGGSPGSSIYYTGGNVGIGTATPAAKLHLETGDLLVTGTYSGTPSAPTTGAGVRMFFDSESAAFRAGQVTGTEWNNASIGARSVALGYNVIASGPESLALGYGATASGDRSVSIGGNSSASGYGAVALGGDSYSTGNASTAVGHYARAYGNYSSAFGKNAQVTATGTNSMVLGVGDAAGAQPRVSGANSLGIFMGDQSGVDVTSANVMSIMGGNVGIGTASPSSLLHIKKPTDNFAETFIVEGDGEPALALHSSSASAVLNPLLITSRSRGARSSKTIVSSGDTLFEILAQGYDGTTDRVGAYIKVNVDGTPGSSDMPGRIEFHTQADGGGGSLEGTTPELVIKNTGNIGIGVASPTAGTRLDITGTGSTASSIIIPRDTVANRPTGVNGMIRYASDTNKFEAFQNGGWIDMIGIGSASGVAASNGTDAAPSISFSGDPNTGFYSSGADSIGITTNGSQTFNITSNYLSGASAGGAMVKSGASTAGAPTFSFVGDSDTGWWNPGADTLAASTAGSERMRIDNAGNVGIGTTSPATHLHVRGSGNQFVKAESTDTGNAGIMIENTAGQYVWETTSAGSAGFWNSFVGGYSLFVDKATNKVGIGTSSPGYRLDVQESNSSDGTLLNINNTNGAAVGSWIHLNGGGGSNWDVGQDGLGFGLFSGSNRRLTVQTGGNVGIGTTSPTSKLHVASDTNENIIGAEFAGDTAGMDSEFSMFRARGTLSAKTIVSSGDNIGSFWAFAYDGTDYENAATIEFEVDGTPATSGDATDMPGRIVFRTTPDGSDGALERMRITNAGYIGIGSTAPSRLLHVGSASVTTGTPVANFQNADGTCTITPAASGSGIACSSDERLKENFRDVAGDFALDNILKLQAVTYNFKTASDDDRHTGYRAQEVQKIAPEFVREDDNGFLQVYYDAFIPWITEALKSLYGHIKSLEDHQSQQARTIAALKSDADERATKLEAENKKLKQENAEIKARLNKIEQMLNAK